MVVIFLQGYHRSWKTAKTVVVDSKISGPAKVMEFLFGILSHGEIMDFYSKA